MNFITCTRLHISTGYSVPVAAFAIAHTCTQGRVPYEVNRCDQSQADYCNSRDLCCWSSTSIAAGSLSAQQHSPSVQRSLSDHCLPLVGCFLLLHMQLFCCIMHLYLVRVHFVYASCGSTQTHVVLPVLRSGTDLLHGTVTCTCLW